MELDIGKEYTCKFHNEESKNLWANTPKNGISPWYN